MSVRNGSGITVGLLGVAFIVLKLLDKITWDWWLVLIPFWGGFALALIFMIIFFLIAVTIPKRL